MNGLDKESLKKQEHCTGCGVKLQSLDTHELGYLPLQAFERDPIICQRCFRMKNYNESSAVTPNQDDFLRILGNIGQTNALIVHIVDIFDFEGSIISGLHRFVGGNPILLVVNKFDLLPKVTNSNRLVNWVQEQVKLQGLKIIDVVICSAAKNIGIDRLLELMNQHRRGKDIYVVGATNVGKSSLINRLMRDHSDLNADLTISRYPGTTLDLIHIPLSEGKSIIDTPGIMYDTRLTEVVDVATLRTIMPEQTIKPVVYQLNEGQTLFFGALVRFDFVQGERQSFSCFISNQLHPHRTKLERADELYDLHKGELLSPPALEHLDTLPAWTRHSLRIPKNSKMDISISGLGWIKVNGDIGALLEVYAPKGIKVVLRKSII